jgi:hypothetical protein
MLFPEFTARLNHLRANCGVCGLCKETIRRMNLNEIKEWLIPLASFIGIVSTSVGVWLALREFRLKLAAETRLSESSRAETDIRLLKHFTDVLLIATGRIGTFTYSKEAAEHFLQSGSISEEESKNANVIREGLSNAAFLSPVAGASSRDAAFASIAVLAIRHPVLKQPAIQALESFEEWAPELSKKYLEEIKDA